MSQPEIRSDAAGQSLSKERIDPRTATALRLFPSGLGKKCVANRDLACAGRAAFGGVSP